MNDYQKSLYDLVGKEIEINIPQMTTTGTNLRKGKYLITEAYPYYVIGIRTCENGYEQRECFNIGTLVAAGIIQNSRRFNYADTEDEL